MRGTLCVFKTTSQSTAGVGGFPSNCAHISLSVRTTRLMATSSFLTKHLTRSLRRRMASGNFLLYFVSRHSRTFSNSLLSLYAKIIQHPHLKVKSWRQKENPLSPFLPTRVSEREQQSRKSICGGGKCENEQKCETKLFKFSSSVRLETFLIKICVLFSIIPGTFQLDASTFFSVLRSTMFRDEMNFNFKCFAFPSKSRACNRE